MYKEYEFILQQYLDKIKKNTLSYKEEKLLEEFVNKHTFINSILEKDENLIIKYMIIGWYIHEQLHF